MKNKHSNNDSHNSSINHSYFLEKPTIPPKVPIQPDELAELKMKNLRRNIERKIKVEENLNKLKIREELYRK